MSEDNFLLRWSRRKHEAKRDPAPAVPASPPPPAAPASGERSPTDGAAAEPKGPEPLPPVESLTPESDFSPFMRTEVDPATRRQALKTLFQDPRFNVMDGLDVYIDDYSKPDPLPEGWLEKMTQMARLGDFNKEKPPAEEAAVNAPEAAQVAEKIPGEQPVAESPEANSPDTDNKGATPCA